MSPSSADACACCACCAGPLDEPVRVGEAGPLCSACLFSGRWLPAHPSQSLAVAAERLPEISRTAHDLLKGIVQESEQRFMMQDFDGARQILIEEAARFLAEQRPLLAACLLSRTLRLPGPSARAYHQLGLAARQAGCPREAAQFYKTGSWLAIKAQDGDLARAILADLEALSPAEPWLPKARAMISADPLPGQEQRCSFCGRTAQETGPLITGTAAAVCSGCVRRMMTLDQNWH